MRLGCCPGGPRGFTLIEILVVIVIVGVLIGGVALTMVDRGAERLDTESRRFAALLDAARNEAILQAHSRALGLWRHGYDFFVRVREEPGDRASDQEEGDDEGEEEQADSGVQWTRVSEDRTFRPRELGEDIRLDLYLDGVRAGLESVPPDEPQIFLLSSGEVTPFELWFTDTEGRDRRIEVDPLGRVSWPEQED